MAEVSQVTEHANWPLRPSAGFGPNPIAYRLIERNLRVAEVIFASEPGDVGPVARPQRMTGHDLLDLGEIQIHQEEAIAELVSYRQEPAVPDGAFVDAAFEHAQP
jgi:hypothetical protein